MKPGRNDLCPCGSGKKYKKCCYLKVLSKEEIDSKLQDPFDGVEDDQDEAIEDDELQDDAAEDDGDELQEKLINAIYNLRSFLLKNRQHIKEYNKARKMHGEIVNAMIKFYQDGKFSYKSIKDSISQVKENAVLDLLEYSFDLDTRLGVQSFYDIWIYKTTPNMNCITEDFIQHNRYKKPEKVEFLHGMLNSCLGLFEITSTDIEEGYVFLKEVFTGKEFKIIDIGLSGQEKYGNIYIYNRIISYHGISFGTGLNFVFSKRDHFIKKHIAYHKKNYAPNGEFQRFTQLYNYLYNNPEKNRVVNVRPN